MKNFGSLFFLLGMFAATAQHKLNLVDENIFSAGRYVIRHRPVVYSVHSESYRTALMVGRKFKMSKQDKWLTFYLYWKHAANDHQHSGLRLDIDQTFLKKRLFTRLQARVFWGMNQKSGRQYYIIPAVNYRLGNLRLGPWGMIIYSTAGSSNAESKVHLVTAYLGPSANIPFSKNVGVFMAFVRDLKQGKASSGSGDYLLHVVFYTRFQLFY